MSGQVENDTPQDQDSFNTIADANEWLLSTGRLSDVTFLVGKTKKHILAHKLILMARSSVFEAMFERWETAKNCQVEIPEVNVREFRGFLDYIYTNKFLIPEKDAETILYLANKYSVKALENKCAEFLLSTIHENNAIHLLQVARTLNHEKFKEACLSYVLRNGKEILQGPEFEAMDVDTLFEILQPDGLVMHEVDVFHMVMRWATTACVAVEKEPNAQNKRIVGEKLIPLIRFPLMMPEDFTSEVVNKEKGLLTDEEIIGIFTYFNAGPTLRPELPAMLFSTVARFEVNHYVITLYRISVFLWTPDIVPVTEQTIKFSVSHDLYISGFLLYAPPNEVQLANGNTGVVVRSRRTRKRPVPDGYLIMLDSARKVLFRETFEICEIFKRNPPASIKSTLGVKIRRNEIYTVKISVCSNTSLGFGSYMADRVSVISRNQPVIFDFTHSTDKSYGLLKSVFFYM